MSAAADLAAREIRTAPSLSLPSAPAAGDRRHAPGGWIRWAIPLAAAAAVVALAISLVLVKGMQNGSAVPSGPATSAGPARATGPGGVPRYYAALIQPSGGIMVGDSVTGTTLAKFTPPTSETLTTSFQGITAADDDRTFVVLALSYPTASLKSPGVNNATAIASWYEVRLAPGTAHPARLTSLPIKLQTAHGYAVTEDFASALSGSGKELAVTGVTASGGLAVRVFSVATGQLLHEWSTHDPSLAPAGSNSHGLAGRPYLTWIDGDRVLAVDTSSGAPSSGDLGFGATDTVRELNVAGPTSGDLLADGKVVWNVRTWEFPETRLQSCAGGIAGGAQLISADGTTIGCSAATGPSTDLTLSFLTYPLAAGTVADRATIDYRVTLTAKQGVSTRQALWISPSGDAIVGAWSTYPKSTLSEAPNSLRIGVMSHGKFTPLRFPPGFDREVFERQVALATITW
jgi:hypothetical protein